MMQLITLRVISSQLWIIVVDYILYVDYYYRTKEPFPIISPDPAAPPIVYEKGAGRGRGLDRHMYGGSLCGRTAGFRFSVT